MLVSVAKRRESVESASRSDAESDSRTVSMKTDIDNAGVEMSFCR